MQTNETYGLLAHSSSRLVGREVWVLDTRQNDCEISHCTDDIRGHVVGVGGTAELSGFRIARAETCGIYIFGNGVATLMDGSVEGSALGACVQSEAQDLDALMSGVRYIDNGSNLSSTSLPVLRFPAPA